MYVCETCHFMTCRSSHYERHTKTQKHLNAIDIDTKHYICECGREYASRQNLRRHKSECNQVSSETNPPTQQPITTELIIRMFQENQELKEMLVKQHEEYMKQQSQIMEYCKQPHTTNHHRNFNLNIFLNVQCKDAINMSDFVKELTINPSETELFSSIGFVEGISRIIMNRMTDLGIHKRPIHCTDVKREIMYVKDEDKWDKDDDHAKTKQLIEKIRFRNIRVLDTLIPVESFVLDANEYTKQCALIRNTTGGMTAHECHKNHEKILHTLSKNLMVSKDQFDDIMNP